MGSTCSRVIAPEEADAHEAALLEREEAAAKACMLTMHDDGQGVTRGSFAIPTFHGAGLRKMLTAGLPPSTSRPPQGAGAAERPRRRRRWGRRSVS